MPGTWNAKNRLAKKRLYQQSFHYECKTRFRLLVLVQEGTTSNLGCFQKRCHALIRKKKNTPRDPLAANRLETGYKHRDDCAKYFLVEKSTGVVQWADPPVLSWQRGSEYGILEMKNKTQSLRIDIKENNTRGRRPFIFSCDRFSCVRRASVLVGIWWSSTRCSSSSGTSPPLHSCSTTASSWSGISAACVVLPASLFLQQTLPCTFLSLVCIFCPSPLVYWPRLW